MIASNTAIPIKQKKCRNPDCGKLFTPRQTTQTTCWNPACALAVARIKREKRERKQLRLRKELIKTFPQLQKECQKEFNAYIRSRDRDQPCISCGRYDHEIPNTFVGGKWDCGHYRSVGACPELRFEPRNAHKQCKYCNKTLSGNIQEYRKGLINRYGEHEVDWLEGPHPSLKLTKDDLRDLKKYFREQIKHR